MSTIIVKHSVKQNEQVIIFDVCSEHLTQDNYSVEISNSCIEICIQKTKTSELMETVDLFHDIDPKTSKYEYSDKKLTFTLIKEKTGMWSSLNKNVSNKWNKIENHATSLDKQEEMVNLMKFFKGIYKNSSDESKQAMNRSMFESNGTKLSTNINDIDSKDKP